jgi:cell division protein FtsW (lipid II flippase)
MNSRTPAARFAAVAALACPWLTIALGASIAHASGVRWGAFGSSFAAALLGTLAVGAVLAWRNATLASHARLADSAPAGVGAIACCILAATLLEQGYHSAHRWISLGGFQLEISMVASPVILAAVAFALASRDGWKAIVLAAAAQAVHIMQPDRAQASALAAGVLVLCASIPGAASSRAVAAVAALGGALAAWPQPDSVPPVPHVERIIQLAAARGASWLAASVVMLALCLVPFVWFALKGTTAQRSTRALAASFVTYSVTTMVMPLLGNYPVPLLGAGAGGVLGWFVMMGILVGHERLPRA